MNRPRRVDGYRMQVVDGETLLYNPADSRVLYCNETASLIWHLCDGTRTAAEIASLLADEYPEGADRIPDEVGQAVAAFLDAGAVALV